MGKECLSLAGRHGQCPHPERRPTCRPRELAPLAGGQGMPRPDRLPGPKIQGGGWAEAAFGSLPTSGKAEAIGLDRHKPRLGRLKGGHTVDWDRTRPRPGRLGAQGPVGHSTDRPSPAAAGSGKGWAAVH